MILARTDRLPVGPAPQRAALAGLARGGAALASPADHPALHLVELGGAAPAAAAQRPLSLPLRVAAWNLERCLFPEASAAALAGVDVALLSEMDNGMARSGQAHTSAEIARHLGMSYAYGVEFLELDLGSPVEREFCTDTENALGFHGNAVLARSGLSRPFLLRLPGQGRWFHDAEQPRLGGRVAVGGVLSSTEGPIVVVSTHLESACDAAHRQAQMAALIGAIDAAFGTLPVLIGGDLNTGNHCGGDWRAETLFETAGAAGFTLHGGAVDQPTTRPSRITRFPDRAMKLDWFLARGLCLGATRICPALDAAGQPLSDHDRIETTITAIAAAPG